MKTILTVVIALVLICIALFTANYFTLFGYYLPHKGQLVEMRAGDISVTSHPEFIALSDNISDLRISSKVGAFPVMLINGEYHYIYWLEEDEFNNSHFKSTIVKYGFEFVDLGEVNND